MSQLTLIKTIKPSEVCKTYSLTDNKLQKVANAHISEGVAQTVSAQTTEELIELLEHVGSSNDLVLCNGIFKNDPGVPFQIITEKRMVELFGEIKHGVVEKDGQYYAARLQESMLSTDWVLLDADSPEGMPPEMASLNITQRLEAWDQILPGLKQCERVEVKSSSARVLVRGQDDSSTNHSHAWIRLTHPQRLDVMRSYIKIAMVLKDLSFKGVIHLKDGTTKQGMDLSVFDLATLSLGRLIFNAKPNITQIESAGYHLGKLGAHVVNAGSGAFDNSKIVLPDMFDMDRYATLSGHGVDMKRRANSVQIDDNNTLSFNTEIAVQKYAGSQEVVKTLGEWIDTLRDQGKNRMRCQSILRASNSMAGFIAIEPNGSVRYNDSGDPGVTYWLAGQDFATERRKKQREENRKVGEGLLDVELDPEQHTIDQMLDRFIYVDKHGEIRDIRNPRKVWDLSLFKVAFKSSVVLLGRAKKQIADMWLESPARKTVHEITFAAGEPPITLGGETMNAKALNLWKDRPDFNPPDNWQELAQPFIDHITWLFEDATEPFLDWLAHVEQEPGVLPHYGFLHISKNTGLGRNWVSSVLTQVFRGYCAPGIDLVRLLTGQFNRVLASKVLIIVDEIKAATAGERWKYSEKLKSIVTAEVREINGKNANEYWERNAGRFLVLSNHLDALPLDETDRRWYVHYTTKTAKLPEEYQKLYQLLKNPDFIDSVTYFLRVRDISNFNPGERPPMNEAKSQVMEELRSDLDNALESLKECWPSDLITSREMSTALRILLDFDEKPHRNKLSERGFTNLGRGKKRQLKVNGRLLQVFAIRNADVWSRKSNDSIRQELQKVTAGEKSRALGVDVSNYRSFDDLGDLK